MSDNLMRKPDMWNSEGEQCLLVVKNGNTSGTTLGRANGTLSFIHRDPNDPHTSIEWAILN